MTDSSRTRTSASSSTCCSVSRHENQTAQPIGRRPTPFVSPRPDSEQPVPLDLPIQWLWDMLDEFVYQFQSFAQWRSVVKNKSEDELAMLAENPQIWSCYSVLNVLYSLVQKSQINEQLVAEKNGSSPEEVA